MKRIGLLQSKEYWLTKMQVELYNELLDFMQAKNLTQKNLAEMLGVTQGYVSQLLNGNFNHKIEKLVELSLVMGKAPVINYPTIENYYSQEESGIMFPYKFFQYYSMQNPVESQFNKPFRFDLEGKNGSIQYKGNPRNAQTVETEYNAVY